MALPRLMVIKSYYNNKYLRFIKEEGEVHRLQRFSGEEVVSALAKYEVEPAKCGKGLVHIRCCYNNKYWVRWSESHWWIAAQANEPEEDTSKWSCTLFEPIFIDGDAKTLCFRHVQLQHYACLWRAGHPYESCLYAGSKDQDRDKCHVYTIIDWESLVILPKHIAFKDDNGCYLKAYQIQRLYLLFSSNDIGDEFVGDEVFPSPDGSVSLKNTFFKKFWRYHDDWISPDSDDSTGKSSDTLFWPVKIEDNVIALRNLGNNKYCKRIATKDLKNNCISATLPKITSEAHLIVEEPIISRNISNVYFRLGDSRIYNQSVITLASGTAINLTEASRDADIKISYTDTRSSLWNTSVSLKLGVKTRIHSGIPSIQDGKLEISDEFSGAYQWGETRTSKPLVEKVYKVIVPPKTTIKLNLEATRASCDVPFTYCQHDTLVDGQLVAYSMDDGVYTGVNFFNLEYVFYAKKTNMMRSSNIS